MPFNEVFLLAIEALVSNKLRAGLTMLGMIIGVGAVVLLVSIGNGAKNYISKEFEGIGTNLILIQPGKTDTKSGFGPPIGSTKRRLTLGDADALEKQGSQFLAVTPVMFGAGNIKTGMRSNNTTIIGCNEKFPMIINVKVSIGEFFTKEENEFGRRLVVLGHNVARNIFPDEDPIGKLVKVAEAEHRVIGVTEKAGDKLGFNMDDLIFIPTKSAMRLFNEDKLFGIRVRARGRGNVEDAVKEIKSILMQRHNNQEDFTILTQDAMLGTMNNILGVLTYVLGGIAMISMIVGGIGIMNIMLVSVTERTREIGVRRAVGARSVDILKQFLAEAMALSITGGLLGCLGSVGLTYLIYLFTPSFDLRAPWWIIPPAFLLSSVTGIIFGVWPARKAAHMNTIEALRFE